MLLSRKSQDSSVEIFDYPAKNEKIPPKFDFFRPNFHFILPNFHFILPNFYFGSPWGFFVCSLKNLYVLGREVPRRADYNALTLPLISEKHLIAYESQRGGRVVEIESACAKPLRTDYRVLADPLSDGAKPYV